MKKNAINLVILAALLVWQSGIANRLSKDFITPAEVKKAIESGTGILVDVREKDEVETGIVKGAKWIPLSGISSETAEVKNELSKLDRNVELMLYCRSGNRSGKAAGILKEKGFKVRNAGGYNGLIDAGLSSELPKINLPSHP